MEHFNSILFHKSGPANKHHINQSFNHILAEISLSERIELPEIHYHAGDYIAALTYSDVSRELSVDSKNQHRSQSSEDVGH